MNSAYLVGRLTKDPEIEQYENGKRTRISLAIGRPFRNSEGLYETDYITCTVWNAIADRVCEYCKKGDMISVKARIQNNNYVDKNDNKVYTYEFIAEQVSFMQNAKNNDNFISVEKE